MENKKRHISQSQALQIFSPIPSWSQWTTRKAVKDGYIACGWVYKAISMIVKQCASIPWKVVDKDGVVQEGHPIHMLLQNPSPSFSTYDLMELLIAWGQLSGKGYIKAIESNGRTIELIPVSPDRILPVAGESNDSLVDGYKVLMGDGVYKRSPEYTPENIIYFRLVDPSDPINGISPLQACAKSVDIDVEQQAWNKSSMQNRGIVDSVFTFAEKLDSTAYDTVKSRVKEMLTGKKNAHGVGVIGANAKFQRLSLTPAEMDFMSARQFNKEEIFSIFGIPLPLVSAESQTYSNMSSSLRIMWEMTNIPILSDMCSTFNTFFHRELGGYKIAYDLSEVGALKEDEEQSIKMATSLFRMGVPMDQLTAKYNLGIEKYDGWDKSYVSQSSSKEGDADSKEE